MAPISPGSGVTSGANSTGISIFFPTRQGFRTYHKRYKVHTLAQETEWFNFLSELATPNLAYLTLEDVILDLDPASMKATILSLPEGAQTSISHLASKMVSDGRLDSVKKIKILDEIFDTDMTVMTGLFN